MIYLELFLTFMKIGAFTFGGGYAMLPLIESEVIKNGWMEMQELVNFIAVSESTPGPFAVNISTYVGAETAGLLGAICATVGVVLPSFIIILIVAKCFAAFKQSKVLEGCMRGLRPAVVALIAGASISVGKSAFVPNGLEGFSNSAFIGACIIFLFMVFLQSKKVHPIGIIIISGLMGVIGGYI